MKRYVRASYGWEPTFEGTWSPEEIELWKSIDWDEWWRSGNRGYDYPITDDTITGTICAYGVGDRPVYKQAKFVKYLRSNPRYDPYYALAPDDTQVQKFIKDNHLLGPMYDGQTHDGYHIHNRYETQAVYDMLSM